MKFYVKSILQYHSGIVFGKAVNKPNKLGNTVLSFMLICLSDGRKFLCRILPVKELDVIFLFEQTDIIIKGIKQVWGELIAIICDGNRDNQFFFRMFDTHIEKPYTAWKVSKYGVFSGPYFPAFGLNTERYGVFLRIQSEYGKIRTRRNSVFGHFSPSDGVLKKICFYYLIMCIYWTIFVTIGSQKRRKIWVLN